MLDAVRTADLLPAGTRFRLIEVAYAAVPPAIEKSSPIHPPRSC